MSKTISILGSTGSIGRQTLDVAEQMGLRVAAITANSCDVAILLSHCGYEADQEWADRFPFLDVIIGGHSHTKLEGNTFRGEVLITQAENNLHYATLTKIHLSDGQIVRKESELIDVRAASQEQELVTAMLTFFSHNEKLIRNHRHW